MIETDALPGRRCVTVLAGGAVAASMHVINRVTTIARRRSAVKYVTAMAVNALDIRVLPGQPITDGVMIETGFGPGNLVVAILA